MPFYSPYTFLTQADGSQGTVAGIAGGGSSGGGGGGGTSGVSGSLLASGGASGGTNGGATGAYLQSFDPTQLQYGSSGGVLSNGMHVVGVGNYNVTEGGVQGDGSISGYSAFDPAHQGVGDTMYDYDSSGKYVGSHVITPENGTWKDLATGIATVAAAYFGFNAAFAGVGGAAGDAVQADSINALDAHTGVDYGSTFSADAGGATGLTGPTSVNADYNLLDGTKGLQTSALEDNAGQGLNLSAKTGTGLDFNTTPNLTDMGGAQGITTTGAQTLGDASSFINDPALNVADAAQQIISENGIYTPESPYVPDLGNPLSPINGGPNPWPTAPGTPGDGGTPGDNNGPGNDGGNPGGGFPFDLQKFLDGLLKGLSLLGGGGGGGGGQPPITPIVPQQPAVGAGASFSNNAQGGASGSEYGIASTLLTTKDTFGYGRSMLG